MYSKSGPSPYAARHRRMPYAVHMPLGPRAVGIADILPRQLPLQHHLYGAPHPMQPVTPKEVTVTCCWLLLQVVEQVEVWVHLRNAPVRRRWADEPPPAPPTFPLWMVGGVGVGAGAGFWGEGIGSHIKV